jgi:hypothetical protein
MSRRHASARPVPAPLSARLKCAVEIAPQAAFRIDGAGARLAHLFRNELLQRMTALSAPKPKEAKA